jgi:hypothetical protein
MNNVTELLYCHKMIDLDGLRLANPIDVVSGEINKHDVFRPVLFRRKKLFAKLAVLCKSSQNSLPCTDNKTNLLESFLS